MKLSPRRTQVLELVAQGNTNPEIAQILRISPYTVLTHLKHIFELLGARDRAHAVALGLRAGLLDPGDREKCLAALAEKEDFIEEEEPRWYRRSDMEDVLELAIWIVKESDDVVRS